MATESPLTPTGRSSRRVLQLVTVAVAVVLAWALGTGVAQGGARPSPWDPNGRGPAAVMPHHQQPGPGVGPRYDPADMWSWMHRAPRGSMPHLRYDELRDRMGSPNHRYRPAPCPHVVPDAGSWGTRPR